MGPLKRRSQVITARSLLHNAVHLLTQRPLKTLVVVAPALVLMGGVSVIAAVVAPDVLRIGADNPDISGLADGFVPLSLVAAFVISYALMAILWHRHTLSGNRSPQPLGLKLIGGYLWRVVALALIQLVASLTLVMPLMILSETGSGGIHPPSLPSILLTTLISQTVMLWFLLRLSLILPAAALGRSMRIAHSWLHTRRIARPLWGVAVALALVNTAFTAVFTLFELTTPVHVVALELPVYVIEGLLIFSVLTTLYSLLVQKNTSRIA